jgi:two-component system, LytTR family, response regulator AlgR
MTAENAIRTLIVDDEPLAIERMQMLCAREPRITLVGTAADGESALRLATSLTPDLILLDIAMPLLDGMAVARALAGRGEAPAIIFVTAFDRFAIEAFDVAAVDYLLKPVSPERLSQAVDRVASRIAIQRETPDPGGASPSEAITTEFWVPHRAELVRIDAGEIDRIEAERDYMRLHVGNRSYLLHETISALEQRLDAARFVRLHRSHIVRRDRIASLRHNGNGVWFATLAAPANPGGPEREALEIRIGRTYLSHVKMTMLG